MTKNLNQKLIICIIKKGFAKKMIKAAKSVGMEGATLMRGSGTADVESLGNVLGLTYNPERDIIISAVNEHLVDNVIKTFKETGKIEARNTGIIFVLNLDQCMGIAHLMNGGFL